MSIPVFNKRGQLDKGIHQTATEEFFERFCYGKDTVRERYKKVLEQLFAFSISRGVKSVIVAGSFITNKEEPKDLDCIIIFPNEKCIPPQMDELLIVEGCELDIMCVSETNKNFLYSLFNMFSLNRFDIPVGLVEIVLDGEKDKSTWSDYEEYNSVEKLLEEREAYIHRSVIRGVAKKKVLVTLCNAKEYFNWNYNLAPVISSAGWIFAPFIYDSDSTTDTIDQFNSWIRNIYYTYETDISVFADGLGTYLLGKFLKNDKGYRITEFDKIILSKSLLYPDFDWKNEVVSSRINFIINMKDTNITPKRNEKIPKSISKDPLLGDSCKLGFTKGFEHLLNYPYDYDTIIKESEFKDKILPMFHISEALSKNFDNGILEHLCEITEKQISLADIVIKNGLQNDEQQ